MLFGYPASAIAENWLHEALCGILRRIHKEVEEQLPTTPWPAILPEEVRETLRRKTGLRDRLNQYRAGLTALAVPQRASLLVALEKQNEVAQALTAVGECDALGGVDANTRQVIVELFDYAFNLLGALGVRDRQFKIIFPAIPDALCPFCACERFDAPTAPRDALDHYLAISLYPFAGANLQNLVPMGTNCNSKYKRVKDVLRNSIGARRRSYYPYAAPKATVRIDALSPFDGSRSHLPNWLIEFLPACEEAQTWNEVFDIAVRYRRDHLDVAYRVWLEEFRHWLTVGDRVPNSVAELIAAVGLYADNKRVLGFQDRSFLKTGVFDMLRRHCEEGNARLIRFLAYFLGGPGLKAEAGVYYN